MDVQYINPFLNATVKVLETMAFLKVRPGKPYVKKNSSAAGDVSGIIGITGDVEGSFSISFSKECIKKVVSNMLGEEVEDIDDEVKDAVGELTNIISGDARRELSEKGLSLNGSLPTVVAGPSHEIKHVGKGPTIALPFETDAGPVTVEVCFNH